MFSIMEITIKELTHLQSMLDQLDKIIAVESEWQNNSFDVGIDLADKDLKKAYAIIKRVEKREVKKMAMKIVRKNKS